RIRHAKVRQELDTPGQPAIARALPTAEEQRTGVAGTMDPAARRLDQVLMLLGQISAAELATLGLGPSLHEPRKRGKRVWSRRRRHHGGRTTRVRFIGCSPGSVHWRGASAPRG